MTHIEVNLHQNNRKNLKEDLEIIEDMEVVTQIRKPFEELFNELSSLISSENNLVTKVGITNNLIEKIKDSLIDFCDHKQKWENKAKIAKEKIEKYFNAEIMGNNYMNHFSEKFTEIKLKGISS